MISRELPLQTKVDVSKHVPYAASGLVVAEKNKSKAQLTSSKDKHPEVDHRASAKGSFATLLQKEHKVTSSEVSLAGALTVAGELPLSVLTVAKDTATHAALKVTNTQDALPSKVRTIPAFAPTGTKDALGLSPQQISKKTLPVVKQTLAHRETLPPELSIKQKVDIVPKITQRVGMRQQVAVKNSNISQPSSLRLVGLVAKKVSVNASSLSQGGKRPANLANLSLTAPLTLPQNEKTIFLKTKILRGTRLINTLGTKVPSFSVLQKNGSKPIQVRTAKGASLVLKKNVAGSNQFISSPNTGNLGMEKLFATSLIKHVGPKVVRGIRSSDSLSKQTPEKGSNVSASLATISNASSVLTPGMTFASMTPTIIVNGYAVGAAANWLQGDGRQLLDLAMAKARESGLPVQSSVEMTLIPAHLGKLKLNIHAHSSGQLEVQFVTSIDTSRTLLEKFLPDLKEQLLQSGFAGVSVDVRSDSGSSQQFARQTPLPMPVSGTRIESTPSVGVRGATYTDHGSGSDGFFAEA